MATAAKPRRTKTADGSARVRMYRHGLGDCFLVRFPRSDGAKTFNILIDCGLISVATAPKQSMQQVVADIAKTCNGHLDVVIMTHEHWDHASGFSVQQAQQEFDQLTIGEAWYAWTENPENGLGKKLRKERAAKVKALEAAAVALRDSGFALGVQRADRLASILQFFGVESLAAAASGSALGKTRAAFDYLSQRQDVAVRYRHPAEPPIDLENVDGVRVYVLGPPEDEGLIKRSSPTKKGQEVYEFASDLSMDDNLASAFSRMHDSPSKGGGPDCPFEDGLCFSPGQRQRPMPAKLVKLMEDVWSDPELAWRRIEFDWTASAETLALNLDNHTNNTCLVVAFELVRTGQVLLFAADAQVGNWLSWQDTAWRVKDGDGSRRVTGPDLLQRTVFYKVGHHGSHNATLRVLGLEQMTSPDLIAFVPVFKSQAEKNRWMSMPFAPLVKRLREKTGGRLVFSDSAVKTPSASGLGSLSGAQKNRFLDGLTATDLYYEYSFKL